ncbi:hypothetical protein FGL95_16200 [Nocardiaceae bacterium YC2-7]|uniref:Uncharacterized protein n=1 Tax=Antrihabitans stalactiti TaxID=2584121 RepID=A0A848KCI4_9NOCA|nr:hypothetical protein [Antrihabitans stalactiti]
MSDSSDPNEPTSTNRRSIDPSILARVFGDVLPDRTSDEISSMSTAESDSGDEWIRRQVPPHHG